jgi:hypothetical protein
MDQLVARAEQDAAYRQAVLADLEQALRDVGVEPTKPDVERIRERLSPGG